jgi:transcriptional regulator with XRE-family HTH domain
MRVPTEAELKAIGLTIRATREQQNRTQEDVAHAIGIDQSIVSRLERGKYKRPNVAVLMSISQEVGCNPLPLIEPFFHTPVDYRPEQVAS